jgi:hypothetical protein
MCSMQEYECSPTKRRCLKQEDDNELLSKNQLNKSKKNALNRLVSNMVVTGTSKQNSDFYVALCTNQQEGISFQQFIQLFDAMSKACSRSILHFKKQEFFFEFMFPGHIVGNFYTTSEEPQWFLKKTKSRLLFKDDNTNAALKFTLVETKQISGHDSQDEPSSISITERWIFVHKNQIRYEFSKHVSGKTKEDACAQEPKFLVRMFIEDLSTIATNPDFIEHLLKKSFEIFGHGSHPSLVHCPLRHKSRKPSQN